jgi:hypothetical protein
MADFAESKDDRIFVPVWDGSCCSGAASSLQVLGFHLEADAAASKVP